MLCSCTATTTILLPSIECGGKHSASLLLLSGNAPYEGHGVNIEGHTYYLQASPVKGKYGAKQLQFKLDFVSLVYNYIVNGKYDAK